MHVHVFAALRSSVYVQCVFIYMGVCLLVHVHLLYVFLSTRVHIVCVFFVVYSFVKCVCVCICVFVCVHL